MLATGTLTLIPPLLADSWQLWQPPLRCLLPTGHLLPVSLLLWPRGRVRQRQPAHPGVKTWVGAWCVTHVLRVSMPLT